MVRSRAAAVGLVVATVAACGGSRRQALPDRAGSTLLDDRGVLHAAVCRGADLRPPVTSLAAEDLAGFLTARGFQVQVMRARTDLVYIEVLRPGAAGIEPVRLRVARLRSPEEAGRELHEAILQHGAGSWGVHRANLAVLAPAGDVDAILAFAASTGLACWGVLTIAGRDDAFVVPGGYREM